MNRIDPAAVPGQFLAIKITPVRGNYLWIKNMQPCGCLLGMLVSQKFGVAKSVGNVGHLSGEIGLDDCYTCGLSDGWEGDDPDCGDREFQAGRQDGAAAWQACVASGLVVEDSP